MKRTATALLALALAGCAYADTPAERRSILIGAAGTLLLSAAVVELNDDDGDDCPPLAPGYLGVPERCMAGEPVYSPF